MNGGELIAQVLKNQGVRFVFTLCGGHISPILVGAKNQGIRVIDVRQEPTAVFAADAVSRMTGVPGVAVVTAGPGVTNSVTAVKNAQMAQSPLVLIGGAPATVTRGRGALQDIKQIKLYETLVKWSSSLKQDCDIIAVFEEAFDVSRSGVPGPVFVEYPLDLLYDADLVRAWYEKQAGKGRGIGGRMIQWYLRRHVDKLFACSPKAIEAAEKENITPFAVSSQDVDKVVERIKKARAPVMIVGSQTALRPDKINELAEGLKNMGVPMYLTGMARGLLGKDHALQFRHNRSAALKEADLVINFGMPCDFRLNYGQSINKKAFYIAVNRSKEDLRKNRRPDIGIQADPCTFLLALSSLLHLENAHHAAWQQRLETREERRELEIREFMDAQTDYVNPLHLCSRIDDALESDSVLIGDGGDFVATAAYIVNPRKPLSWLDPGAYGTLGCGAGFAIAAKLVRPEAQVWLLWGDGAAGYGMMEIDTFVRHDLPIIAVVGNDAGWTQIARDQVDILGDDVAVTLRYNNYDRIAEALDAKGFKLDDPGMVNDVLTQAADAARNGHPVLVNALMGKTDFRKGSISV